MVWCSHHTVKPGRNACLLSSAVAEAIVDMQCLRPAGCGELPFHRQRGSMRRERRSSCHIFQQHIRAQQDPIPLQGMSKESVMIASI